MHMIMVYSEFKALNSSPHVQKGKKTKPKKVPYMLHLQSVMAKFVSKKEDNNNCMNTVCYIDKSQENSWCRKMLK